MIPRDKDPKITSQSGKHSLGGDYQAFIDSKLHVHLYMEQGEHLWPLT